MQSSTYTSLEICKVASLFLPFITKKKERKREGFNAAKNIVLNRLPKKVKNLIWNTFSLDANQRNENGKPLLNIITESGSLTGIHFLLSQGADIDASSNSGYTAFHTAAFQGRVEIIDFLHEKGLNINSLTQNGETALILALMNKHKPVVMSLISKENIDFSIFDKNKKSALHYAAQNGYEGVSQLLLEKGISVNSVDINGKTPLDYAIENMSVIILFIKHILLKNVEEEKPNGIQNSSYSIKWDQIKSEIIATTCKTIAELTNKAVAQRSVEKLAYNSPSSLFSLSFQAISRAVNPPSLTARFK